MVGRKAAGERRAVTGSDADDGCNRLGHVSFPVVVIVARRLSHGTARRIHGPADHFFVRALAIAALRSSSLRMPG